MLNRGGGNQRGAVMGVHEQTHVDELVGEESGVFVVEGGASFYGARGGINLIVEGEQGAFGNLLECRTIEGIHREFRVFAQTLLDLAEIVFGNGEDYGDGLDLRDTASARFPEDCTTLPGSTRRNPTLPVIGAT